MSGLEFTAALVDALAWPAATVVVALVFRRAIRAALSGQIKRWKAGPGGVEIEYWEHTVADARQQLERTTPPAAAAAAVLADELTEVAQVAPGAAVMEAYVRVERELRRITETIDLDDRQRRMGGRQLADLAHSNGLINGETLNAIHGLSVLRNLAAHAHPDRDDLDTARALDYLQLADAVLYALRNQPRHGQ